MFREFAQDVVLCRGRRGHVQAEPGELSGRLGGAIPPLAERGSVIGASPSAKRAPTERGSA